MCVCERECACVCACVGVCVCVCVCVVSVIVKHPVLPPCAVDGRSDLARAGCVVIFVMRTKQK